MKRLMLVLTILFAFLFAYTADVLAYDGFVGTRANRHWKKAIKKDKPVFLYFCSKNCAACENFDPTYKRVRKEYKKKYQFIKLKGEMYHSAKLLRQFNVNYFPNLIAVNPTTLNYKRIETRDYNEIKNNLEEFLRCCNTFAAAACPSCQTCPTNPKCLTCPSGSGCPGCPTCPTGQAACPCPTVPLCPTCPTIQPCPTGQAACPCPCPTIQPCPTCPTIQPGPTVQFAPLAPTCPTCR